MDTSMWNALFELFPRDLRNKRRPARVRLFATLFVAFVVAGMYFKSRPAAHVYSIWFEPPESSEVHSRCGAFIDATAGRLATPHFLPHVTLLGRESLWLRILSLVFYDGYNGGVPSRPGGRDDAER